MPKRILHVLTVALLCAGCQAMKKPPSDPVPADPDAAVTELRNAWFAAPADHLHAGFDVGGGQELRSRAMLRRQAQNLVFRHPDHAGARMLCALMAYEAGDPVEASRHLDHLLRVHPASPDAALLRARIAVEAGNPILAQHLLEEQVRLRPDHAGLRETLASVRFLNDDLDGARDDLAEAERLGAPPARVAYNRGLLAENGGDLESARRHYQKAIDLSPGWALPEERLAGLGGGAGSAKGAAVAEGFARTVPADFPPPAAPLAASASADAGPR
jgi:tetratricopeptide (TPR) repeat protein